ncbi:TetR/AcrR family transcriptional regulator [Litorilinea aerophila]|uniref:TetR/AcrR family transcriptional regulator n=1 Tax=Litorilinea aerophila TaxID=1204385 RepID=A0A540V8X2_9CHLR|nr:TetR/AcrR family transcriptional regulator [Litorilinea aerophila]MCC9078935.1 TetR/AcrR family transcriptional regulator [Litorilinea aerophila]OUC09348.1 hypothetical protein RY27_03400 [Litorilinea aerophila]
MPKIVNDEAVFRAVIQVILAQGYDRATTKQMAKAAGVSEMTLYRKYGSKAALVSNAIQFIAQEMDFESVVHYSGDVYADFLGVVTRYKTLTERYGQFMAVLIPELQRHPELQASMARPLQIMQSIGELIQRYQQEGILRAEHPLHAVAALLGPLVFFAMARNSSFLAQIPPVDLEAHVHGFLEGRRIQGD